VVAVVGVSALTAGAVVLKLAHQAVMETVHPPREVPSPRPDAYGLAYENVSFVTKDGVTLRGWFLPPSGPEHAALIVNPSHGDHRGKIITATAMLVRHGYGVLTFDWRAIGESGGEFATLGYNEAKDVVAAVGWLANRTDVDPARIGALSRSAGAAAVIRAAAADSRIAAVVAETTFSRLQDMLETGVEAKTGLPAFPFAPLMVLFGERETGIRIADVRPVDVIGRISPRAVLIIRAGRDTWIPPDNADMLYAAAGEPKALWDAPEAEHARVEYDDPDEYERRVVAFFDRYLKAEQQAR
jgi:fermentation-respiration switch protein FrsA (DUF1100 family)